MYGPIRPIPYQVMRDRLSERFDIQITHVDPASCCATFRQMRMGLGTDNYYTFPVESDQTIIPEPMLIGLLNRFEIDHREFMDACDGKPLPDEQ